MAQVTGYTCDVCKGFATSDKDNRVPNGWMLLTVDITEKVNGNSTFHICSDKCLRDLGKARYAAGRGEAPNLSNGYNVTPEGRAQMRQNGLRRQHEKGNHDASPSEDCLLCQEATEPSEVNP